MPLTVQLLPPNRGSQQHKQCMGPTPAPNKMLVWDGTRAGELLDTTGDELLFAKPWENAR